MNVNRVLLAGRLTRDPEVKFTPKGTAVAKLGLATSRTYGQGDERKEETTFVDIDVFGKSAENCGQYLKKGSSILVEGRLKLDTWDDKQTGQKRSKLGVVADTVQFGDRPSGERATTSSAPRTAAKEDDSEPPF